MKVVACLVLVIVLSSYIGSLYRIFIITSDSMIPIIQAGDIVITAKKEHYGEGDIVTFKVEERYVTHRLISQDDLHIETKGDANNDKDSFGTSSYEIVGKVIHIIHSAELKKNLRNMF